MPGDGKTEKATPKKKKDERKKGNIFQSKDITSSLGLLGIFVFLRIAAPYLFGYIKKNFTEYFGMISEIKSLNINKADNFLDNFAVKTLATALPVILTAAFAGIIFNIAQTRLVFTINQVKFKFSRLNPINGLKKFISFKSITEIVKSIIKISILGWIFYTEIAANMRKMSTLMDEDIYQALVWLGDAIFFIVIKTGLIMVAFGILDYFYQWWDYERQIKMTKQEIKDEYKQTEGDPLLKSRIKEQQRRISAMRMMEKVPLADVVIRNPTHFAVALKYDVKKDGSPRLIAKGQDYLAFKIIEVATENGISITENRHLARGLYETVDIGQEIPGQFYQAVAEVLAFVYKARRIRYTT